MRPAAPPARAAWIPVFLVLVALPANAAVIPANELPVWKPPVSYKVDLVMSAKGQTFVMKRCVDGGRVRSEIEAEGQSMVMIELGDEKGTSYSLVPKEKMAIKQSAPAITAPARADSIAPADVTIEFLGEEKRDGTTARKYRITGGEGVVDAWFDAASGAPLRMESPGDEKTVIEWKNLEVGPQPGKLFEIPKDYRTIDMDAMMAKAREAMGKVEGMEGMPGITGGMMGVPTGAGVGASLGAAFGGALGATAGPYLGGQVGGWVAPRGAGR